MLHRLCQLSRSTLRRAPPITMQLMCDQIGQGLKLRLPVSVDIYFIGGESDAY